MPGVEPPERAAEWSPDGKSLYVYRRGELPHEGLSGRCRLGRDESSGGSSAFGSRRVVEIQRIEMTPDASAYAYTYVRILSDLYVAEG